MGTKSQTAAVGTSRIAICLFLTECSCLEKSGPILINAKALKRPAMMISYAIPLFPFPNVHKTSFLGLLFFWYHPGSHFFSSITTVQKHQEDKNKMASSDKDNSRLYWSFELCASNTSNYVKRKMPVPAQILRPAI